MRISIVVFTSGLFLLSAACAHTAKQVSTSAPPTVAPAAAPTVAPAAKPPTGFASEEKNKLACARDSESRSIRIETLQPKGCKVWYSVLGKETPVAWSTTGSHHCETVSGKMRGNLESAGYKCAAGDARASASTVTPAAVTQPAAAPAAAAPPKAPAPAAPAPAPAPAK